MPRKQSTQPVNVHASAYGGALRTRRLARGRRTISTIYSMHIVLRSSQARGAWSFVKGYNRIMVKRVLTKHADRTGVQILGTGNAGNHLHLRLKFSNRPQYMRFIRAVTGDLALQIKKIANPAGNLNINFWDRRPFSSIVAGAKYVARLVDYIKVNNLEGRGYPRAFARLVVARWREGTFPEFEGDVMIL